MRVTSLKLANVRMMEAAEFRFQRGVNLIVGVNGVGKTTALQALGACLSAYVKHANRLKWQTETFTPDDIRIGADALSVECDAQIGSMAYSYLIHKPRETNVPQKNVGMPREQIHNTPTRATFLGDSPQVATGREPEGRPLTVMYSTNRAVPSERAPGRNVAGGGTAAAFADAFANRELRLGEFAHWMRAQEVLRLQHLSAAKALTAFEDAASRFLPEYRNLRVDDSGKRLQLLIDRGGITVAVKQMSDGERGTLALVLDLARRLVQANPEMSDPVAQAEAVVLIDEIELHLHPMWQRQIIGKLVNTFPSCQFIATTHSPQVIGEVRHDRIHIISDGEVYSPTHSFGVDSNGVLEWIMETDPRTEKVQNLLTGVSNDIGNQRYDDARESLAHLVTLLGDNDPEVTRIATLLDFLEGQE